jgi:PAS domain S-box-containing protein
MNFSDEEQARSLRGLLIAIIEGSDDAIISKDLNRRITSWNPAAKRMYGYTAEEAIGQPISMLVPPGHADETLDVLEKIKRGERVEHYETKRMRKDGTILDVSLTVSPIYDADNRIIGASKIARDISDRRQEEKAQALLAAIVEDSDDAIISKDLIGIITSWNKGAERMYGYTAEEAIGQPI